MAEVSRFKILEQILTVNDGHARDLLSQYKEKFNGKIDELNSKINDSNTHFNDEIDKIIARGAHVINVVSDYEADNTGKTDSTQALKNAIENNSNAVIFFPSGSYITTEPIKINSNTYLYGKTASVNNYTSDVIFINNSSGTNGNYYANNNIIIDGLSILGHNLTQTCIAFGHCRNIRIINCELGSYSDNHSTQNWHLLEINSCKNVWIDKCYFTGTATFSNEMLQLDVATSEEAFPWFGPYDNTACIDVNITNCTFTHPEKYYSSFSHSDVAIGNHNGSSSAPIRNISINNCQMNNVKTAFRFAYLANSSITNNNIENCISGFAYSSSHIINNTRISDNVFRGNVEDYTTSPGNTEIGRGISIGAVNGQYCANNIISNNIIENFASHGIAVQGKYCDISNNIIRSCGQNGLYADYNELMCNLHGNLSASNGVLNNSAYDIFVSHTKTENFGDAGRNDIYNNKCNSLKCLYYSENMYVSRVYNNIYNTIQYPSSPYLTVYGNNNYNGNTRYRNSAVIPAASVGTWTKAGEFTVDHTCYMNLTYTITLSSNLQGFFIARIRSDKYTTAYAYQMAGCNAETASNTGLTLNITDRFYNGHTIYGEFFFIAMEKPVSVTGIIKAVELPIPFDISKEE